MCAPFQSAKANEFAESASDGLVFGGNQGFFVIRASRSI